MMCPREAVSLRRKRLWTMQRARPVTSERILDFRLWIFPARTTAEQDLIAIAGPDGLSLGGDWARGAGAKDYYLGKDLIEDPYPFYDRVRTKAPLYYSMAIKAWWVTSFDLAQEVLLQRSATRESQSLAAAFGSGSASFWRSRDATPAPPVRREPQGDKLCPNPRAGRQPGPAESLEFTGAFPVVFRPLPPRGPGLGPIRKRKPRVDPQERVIRAGGRLCPKQPPRTSPSTRPCAATW